MTKFEYPGMEEGLCAGLRTMDGDGEPYETCKECRLQYQYNDMHQEAEEFVDRCYLGSPCPYQMRV